MFFFMDSFGTRLKKDDNKMPLEMENNTNIAYRARASIALWYMANDRMTFKTKYIHFRENTVVL